MTVASSEVNKQLKMAMLSSLLPGDSSFRTKITVSIHRQIELTLDRIVWKPLSSTSVPGNRRCEQTHTDRRITGVIEVTPKHAATPSRTMRAASAGTSRSLAHLSLSAGNNTESPPLRQQCLLHHPTCSPTSDIASGSHRAWASRMGQGDREHVQTAA